MISSLIDDDLTAQWSSFYTPFKRMMLYEEQRHHSRVYRHVSINQGMTFFFQTKGVNRPVDQFDGVLLAGIDYTGGAVKPDGGLSQAINAIRSDKRLMFPAWKPAAPGSR